jgi:hypothetical protein
MANEIPDLTPEEINILWEIRTNSPRQFFTNATSFFIKEMKKYIYHNQVWRIAIMGETRSGKSEGAQTIAFRYMEIFNKCLKEGYVNEKGTRVDFKEQIQSRLDSAIKLEKLEFNCDKILASQSDYLYKLREQTRDKLIKFGQIWQIDENREQSGLGSYTEKQERDNLNNIIAKFCQCEIWLQPRRFTEANTPYGIKMIKKDFINRCNWGLLYKIEMNPIGVEFNFLGWIKLPLHKHEEHRNEYESKKNDWIKEEMEGAVDDRMRLRHEVAKMLSEDDDFCVLNKKATNFFRTKSQQVAIIERWIMTKKCQNFNTIEKDMIVDIGRDLATSRLMKTGEMEK